MPLTRRALDTAFAQIERAAIAGARCPTNHSKENPAGTLLGGATAALLKEGKIRVEVYAHNWRVIEILDGPNAGKRTQPPPYKYATKPYLVLLPVDAQSPQGD
jgi:hypothetical protein